MIFQGGCCYDYQSLKRGRCVAQAEGHPLPLVQPQFTCKSGLLSVLLPQRDLPEGRTQVQSGEELASPSFERLSSIRGIGYASFIVTAFKKRKSQQNLSCPPFFFATTTPQAHCDFEESIMSSSSNISISARHASDLCGVIRLAPFLSGTAPSSSSISCSTKLQQPISALCFENTSAFRFKTAQNDSKSPSPVFLSICQILVHMILGAFRKIRAARLAVVRFRFH